MDRGAWWAILHGIAKRGTRLSDFTFFLNVEIIPTVYMIQRASKKDRELLIKKILSKNNWEKKKDTFHMYTHGRFKSIYGKTNTIL